MHHCLDQTVGWLQGRKYLCSRKAVKSNVVLSLCVRGRNSPWMENCCRPAGGRRTRPVCPLQIARSALRRTNEFLTPPLPGYFGEFYLTLGANKYGLNGEAYSSQTFTMQLCQIILLNQDFCYILTLRNKTLFLQQNKNATYNNKHDT